MLRTGKAFDTRPETRWDRRSLGEKFMDDEKLAELQAQIDGLQAVLGIALNLLPQEVVLDRLSKIEKTFRARNMSSGAIKVVGSFRKIWQPPPDDDAPPRDG